MVNEVAETYSRIDGLVNAAGIWGSGKEFFDMDTDAFRRVFEVNTMGTFLTSKYVSKIMTGQKRGKIVNISCIRASVFRNKMADYAASKGAVSSMTSAMALDLAPYNVQVNSVAPGFTYTGMTAANFDNPESDSNPKCWFRREGWECRRTFLQLWCFCYPKCPIIWREQPCLPTAVIIFKSEFDRMTRRTKIWKCTTKLRERENSMRCESAPFLFWGSKDNKWIHSCAGWRQTRAAETGAQGNRRQSASMRLNIDISQNQLWLVKNFSYNSPLKKAKVYVVYFTQRTSDKTLYV